MADLLLVVGRSGQLANELTRMALPAELRLVALGREHIDLGAQDAAVQAVQALHPTVVINAAAYTAVDKAETDQLAAFALNRDGPAALAHACASIGAPLIHISTDYVFDGRSATPYTETDGKNPTTVYGLSKSEGEDAVLASGAEVAIIRTSWVYASHGANFVRTMLRLAETRDEIGVVHDQVGRPTWARDLATVALTMAMRAMDRDPSAAGIFHYCGSGDASWAEFAEVIFEFAMLRGARGARVKRIPSIEYPTLANRPANSRLDTRKIEQSLGVRPREWREAIGLCLDELLG